MSFDILSMEALFMVPRICSVMSLNPYFGSLIPVLKEMVRQHSGVLNEIANLEIQTKTFCKFLPVILVLYLGNFRPPSTGRRQKDPD